MAIMENPQTGKHSLPAMTGFTLVELCIVIIISGLIFSAIFDLYTRYLRQTATANTVANIQTSSNQIGFFFSNNLRYPYPSDRTVPINSPLYGLEIDPAVVGLTVGNCYASGPPAVISPAGTNGVGGVCMIPSLRDADGDGQPDPVLIGGVPIRTILNNVQTGVSTNVVFDGWGSKLDYAVSANLANVATYNSTWGVITAHDEFGNNTAGINDDAHYAIISHGADRIGAYSTGGQMSSICLFGVAGAGLDNQNCSNNSTFIESIAHSAAGGLAHYDDYVYFVKSGSSGIWAYQPNSNNIYNLNIGNVGVGTAAPGSTLDVEDPLGAGNGTLRAENNAKAAMICDKTGANCFPVKGFTAAAGSETVKCPANQVMNGIAMNAGTLQATGCAPPAFPFPIPGPQTCPVGKWLHGYATNGTILCQ
jgi:type II secretory pathway pseudopilin PulG